MKRTAKANRPARRALKTMMLKRLEKRLARFEGDEEGGMAITALFVFLLMLTMGGISIDIMRHEMERTQLQATVDSAVLAGAGAPAGATRQEIRDIVEDFFVKSGKGDYLNEIPDDDILANLNSRRVTASADVTLNTYLMKLMGVNTLQASSGATAEVRTPKLEIVLVLDVSGSMANGLKLPNLKDAAKAFVTTVLNGSDPGNTVISVVPYSWGVTPTVGIFEALNVDPNGEHDHSTCLHFEEDDYLTAAISPATVYKQRIFTSTTTWDSFGFEFDNLTEGAQENPRSTSYNRTCYTDEYFQIMPFSINETALHTKIDSLVAAGSTSSHMGMKWAAGLLDPAFRPVITSLQTPRTVLDGNGNTTTVTEMDPTLTNIPAFYNEPETQKVIVLMGDGQNDTTFQFEDPNGLLDRDVAVTNAADDFRGPDSWLHRIEYTVEEFDYAINIFRPHIKYPHPSNEQHCHLWYVECFYETASYDNYYVYDPSDNDYYSVDGNEELEASEFNDLFNLPGFESHEQYSWEEAWGRMTPRFVGNLTNNWTPFNELRGNRIETSDKDSMMEDICTATKGNGVIVYTIGFGLDETDTEDMNAEQRLRDCATSSLNYYRATSLTIADAFGSIASNVQNLRLTQ